MGLTQNSKSGISFKDLVDAVKTKNATGRKQSDDISRLTIACVHRGSGKLYWRCRGSGCRHFRAGNCQLSRALSHAMQCTHLSPSLKSFASTRSTQNALGAKVTPKELQIESQEDDDSPSCKKTKLLRSTLKDTAIAKGTVKFDDDINHKIVMLFCVSGLPLRVLDTPQWKRLMETATKFKYKPTSSTMVSGTFIPAEAALVRSYQVTFLQTLVNLTVTFDGGSTRKPSSVYTIHISTADRECFFVEAYDATDEKHTASYIENLITSVRAIP